MTGQILTVTVTALQPLALGTASEVSYFTDSHRFVPGSVLRGALAAAWIAQHGPPGRSRPEEAFRELFEGPVRFGPLYPDGSARMPLSVTFCKYPREKCVNAFVDRAFQTVEPCAGCGQPMVPSKGGLDLPPHTMPRRVVRTAIDPVTMRAKEKELYGNDALPAGTRLTGTVFGSGLGSDNGWLLEPRTLRLGGRRSVGGAADYSATLMDRPVARATGGTLVLRLTGPAVFVDPAGRPRLEPDRDLDLPNGIEVDAAWTRPLHWSGWHAASRLPKPTDVCAAPGSTYRLTADPAILDAFAQRVLDEGIGLRRAEGFGVVEIATAPWRPPVPPVRGVVPPDEAQPTAQTTVQARMRSLQELALPPQGRAWLVGALRSLQIEQLRALSGQQTISPGTAAEVDTILKELMRQPTAMDLTGRQRDGIRGALTGIDPATLRDLTTLVIAAYAHDPAAASEGPHR